MIRRYTSQGMALVALLVTAGAAVALPAKPTAPRPQLTKATSLVHINSRDGEAVVGASNMVPGSRHSGTVTLTNGGGSGRLMLLTGVSSGSSQELAGRLSISAFEGDTPLMQTTLAGVPACVALGDFGAGASRTFRFDVSFPRGASDNRFANTRASLDLEWIAATGDDCDPAPPATAAPEPPAQPAATAPQAQPEPVPAPVLPEDRSHAITVAGMQLRIEPGPYRFARRTGTARVGIRCLSAKRGVCVGRLGLERRRAGQGRGIAMATGRIKVRAGTRKVITLRLNSRARKRVTSTGRVPVRAYVLATDQNGRRRQATYLDRLIYGRAAKSRNR